MSNVDDTVKKLVAEAVKSITEEVEYEILGVASGLASHIVESAQIVNGDTIAFHDCRGDVTTDIELSHFIHSEIERLRAAGNLAEIDSIGWIFRGAYSECDRIVGGLSDD